MVLPDRYCQMDDKWKNEFVQIISSIDVNIHQFLKKYVVHTDYKIE